MASSSTATIVRLFQCGACRTLLADSTRLLDARDGRIVVEVASNVESACERSEWVQGTPASAARPTAAHALHHVAPALPAGGRAALAAAAAARADQLEYEHAAWVTSLRCRHCGASVGSVWRAGGPTRTGWIGRFVLHEAALLQPPAVLGRGRSVRAMDAATQAKAAARPGDAYGAPGAHRAEDEDDGDCDDSPVPYNPMREEALGAADAVRAELQAAMAYVSRFNAASDGNVQTLSARVQRQQVQIDELQAHVLAIEPRARLTVYRAETDADADADADADPDADTDAHANDARGDTHVDAEAEAQYASRDDRHDGRAQTSRNRSAAGGAPSSQRKGATKRKAPASSAGERAASVTAAAAASAASSAPAMQRPAMAAPTAPTPATHVLSVRSKRTASTHSPALPNSTPVGISSSARHPSLNAAPRFVQAPPPSLADLRESLTSSHVDLTERDDEEERDFDEEFEDDDDEDHATGGYNNRHLAQPQQRRPQPQQRARQAPLQKKQKIASHAAGTSHRTSR